MFPEKCRYRSLGQIMRDFDAWGLAKLLSRMTEADVAAERWVDSGHRDETISDDFIEMYGIRQIVGIALNQAKTAQLSSTFDRVCDMGPFSSAIIGPFVLCTYDEVRTQLKVLRECIEADLEKHHFLFVPPDKMERARQLHVKEGGWATIWERFDSAKYDCKEAVLCFVSDRFTASVFHCMRAAEIGLRALAKRMKVKLPRRGPLMWAEWQEILREMHKLNEQIASGKRGPARENLLEFYRGAIGQFYGFKDEYRNQVMHSRKRYDEPLAASVLNHVHDFMGKLAARIDEKGRTVKLSPR